MNAKTKIGLVSNEFEKISIYHLIESSFLTQLNELTGALFISSSVNCPEDEDSFVRFTMSDI